MTLVFLILMPKFGWIEAPISEPSMALYLIMWGIFTGVMFIGTLKLSRFLQVIFLSLTILFFLLALADATGPATIKTIAGIVGILCGLSATYTALGLVLNDVYKKVVVSL